MASTRRYRRALTPRGTLPRPSRRSDSGGSASVMFRAPLRASLEAVRGCSRPDLAGTGVAAPVPRPSWPWARLASLHHRSPRGLRPPAMALLRFGVSTALEARPIARGSSVPRAPACWVRPTWRLLPDSALPTDPSFGGAHEISLSKLAPARIGTGFPAHALLRFRAGFPSARTRTASGLRSPDGVARSHGRTARSFLRVPL
jgi:hypothetical protein